MAVFFEVIDPYDETHIIQRVDKLTERETRKLRANGYKVIRRETSKALYEFLLGKP